MNGSQGLIILLARGVLLRLAKMHAWTRDATVCSVGLAIIIPLVRYFLILVKHGRERSFSPVGGSRYRPSQPVRSQLYGVVNIDYHRDYVVQYCFFKYLKIRGTRLVHTFSRLVTVKIPDSHGTPHPF